MPILSLHGLHSIPNGLNPTFLRTDSHTVINPKFPDDDMDEAVRIVQAEFGKHQPRDVVG